jgi:hypothetical protein
MRKLVRYPDVWAIIVLYRDAGASIPEVTQTLNLAPTTVRHRLRIYGVTLRLRPIAPTSQLKRQPYTELHRYNGTPEVVMGRKFCPGCGRWRHLCDFPRDRRKNPYYHGRLTSRCEACGNIARRYYYRHSAASQLELRREYWRIYKEAKRREAGVPESTANRRRVTDRKERIFLDPAPLVAEIKRQCGDEYGWLARRSGVSERAIYRLRSGESAHVRIDNADKLALGLGLTLELIYKGEGHLTLGPGYAVSHDLSSTL